MAMQRFISSRIGVGTGLFLGRTIPSSLGYRLTAIAAKFISRRKSTSIVQAVMQNQAVVRGLPYPGGELEFASEEVFQHAGRCFIDLYQNLGNPEKLISFVKIDAMAKKLIEYSDDQSFGAFIVAPHLSNFDLCLLAMAYRGLKAMVLSYGQPRGGYKIQNKIRSQTGLEITPVEGKTHDQAVSKLINGGLVITAVDRPIRKKAHMLDFFDRPSPLPTGHIRMSIQAGVPIIVASASLEQDGKYAIVLSDPIEMKTTRDRNSDIKANGERVLNEIETRIKTHPGQWLMYYPVWSNDTHQ